jgi:hypothetical protein
VAEKRSYYRMLFSGLVQLVGGIPKTNTFAEAVGLKADAIIKRPYRACTVGWGIPKTNTAAEGTQD